MVTPRFETLVDIFEHSARAHAPRELFGEKKDGRWVWMTYGQFTQKVNDLRGGLACLGVGVQDRVAVISNNRSEWAIGAYATYTLGAVYVPMYEAQHVEEWEYILQDCGAKVVLAANDRIADLLEKSKPKLPKLEHIIRLTGAGPGTFAGLLEQGASAPAPMVHPAAQEMAGLIYTSGTTGNPKGVMLSHSNLAMNVQTMHEVFPMSAEERSLAFLPWAHSFGQTVELHALFSMGASLGIAESAEKIVDNLAEVRPTLLFAVPKIFNRIYEGLQKRMATESAVKRLLFHRGMAVAAERRQRGGAGASRLLDVQHAFFDQLVFTKVRARFGGRLKYAFSGGAAISREVAKFIDDLGITVYEGYGLTETSPLATANCPAFRKIGSVGRPIPGVRVEIDRSETDDPKQGEIVIFGHNVMMGYYNLPDENAKVFTPEHGFRSGDMGLVDEDGFVWITGRIKEQYKLENGKFVVPSPIEQELCLSPYIANAMVHGMNKPYNVAIIVPDMEALKQWAQGKGLDASDVPALLENAEVKRLFEAQIAEHTQDVKGYERPQKFLLTAEDFTIANDMLTQKLSLKRRNVLKKYGEAVEQLYTSAGGKAA